MIKNPQVTDPFLQKQTLQKLTVSPKSSNIEELEKTPAFRYYVLNDILSLSKLMESEGFRVSLQGTCFCPFHDDTGHQSAKVYAKSEDSPEHLFCFSEHKKYKVTDFIKLVLEQSPYKEFELVWPRLSEVRKQTLRQKFLTQERFERKSLVKHFEREENAVLAYQKLLIHIESEVRKNDEI